MTFGESFREMSRIINAAEMGRIINAAFPPAPDADYVGNRCGWYPEKPRRKRRRAST